MEGGPGGGMGEQVLTVGSGDPLSASMRVQSVAITGSRCTMWAGTVPECFLGVVGLLGEVEKDGRPSPAFGECPVPP